MNKDTLICSLLATYEAHKELVPLLDEDFAKDTAGKWVKHLGDWQLAKVVKDSGHEVDVAFEGKRAYIKGPSKRYQDLCEHIDSLPRFSLITTWEQRALRTATRRAEEYLAAQTTTP